MTLSNINQLVQYFDKLYNIKLEKDKDGYFSLKDYHNNIWIGINSNELKVRIITIPKSSAEQINNKSGWEKYLSTLEKIRPIAKTSNKVASESGLEGLTHIISTGIRDIKQNKVPGDKIDIFLASIWVTSINAAMLQDIDPFKNPEYQRIIDEGMNFSSKSLHIPDLKSCMKLTVDALTKSQKASSIASELPSNGMKNYDKDINHMNILLTDCKYDKNTRTNYFYGKTAEYNTIIFKWKNTIDRCDKFKLNRPYFIGFTNWNSKSYEYPMADLLNIDE